MLGQKPYSPPHGPVWDQISDYRIFSGRTVEEKYVTSQKDCLKGDVRLSDLNFITNNFIMDKSRLLLNKLRNVLMA